MMFESSQFVSSQTSDPSPTSAKNRDTQPMYPVTVKQIIEATLSTDDKSSFLIDGVVVHNVKVVGMTFNKSARVTDVSFVIDDGTGQISCNRWLNDSQDIKEVEDLTDGTYVRIHGHLKVFRSKKQIVVFAIRPLTNYNEIANHFLECVHAHCSNAKLQSKIQNGVHTPSTSSLAVSTPNAYNAVSSSQLSQEDRLVGIDKLVMDYLRTPASITQDKGIHRDEISQKLKIPEEKIIEVLESLENEGLVYSTIDEFHYKSTAS